VDKNVCWQILCNEKDAQISELKQRLEETSCQQQQQQQQQSNSWEWPDVANRPHQRTYGITDVRTWFVLVSTHWRTLIWKQDN